MTRVTISELIHSLKIKFGDKSVLTEPEHLYVYSLTGGFGFKKQSQPIAVLRINKDQYGILDTLVETTDLPVICNDEFNGSEEPFLLIDNQNPIEFEDLLRRLEEMERERVEMKKKLKTADSFHHWFNVRLQGMDGFRVEKDEGFCVVQSFFDGVQTYSSKGRLTLARGFLKGEVKNSSLLSDSIFSCTACGQCYDQYSMDTFEINNALLKARKELTSDGVPKQFDNVLENIRAKGNPQGLETEDRIIWFEEQAEKYTIKENKIVYWAGCVTAYRLPEVVKSNISVMEKLGLDFGILGEKEGCCGLILYLSGQWRELEKNAENVFEKVGDVETLVTGCAGCYYMFSRVYNELGIRIPLRVLHISQLLDQALGERKLKPYKGIFLWHDPCDLGRHSGVYKPPRDVLHRIPELSLVEYPLTKEHAICCGAGGGLWMYKEELTDYVSHKKMIDTIPKGVEGVITGCPTCYLSMRNTSIAHRPELQVLDLAEVVDKCL